MRSNKKTLNKLKKTAEDFFLESAKNQYSYNFNWLARPIIQYPQDIVGFQEIVWKVKPDLIIETGIAHGGSLVLSASLLSLIDYCEAAELKKIIDPNKPKRKVVGIDIDIRENNLKALKAHALRNRMKLFQGSSIDPDIINKVKKYASNSKNVMVCLDSNHSHEHVLAELVAYSSLVTLGSYCIVYDTVIDDLPDSLVEGKSWSKGNNPKTAVNEFLINNDEFIIDNNIDDKLLISNAPGGYLKKIR